MLCLVTLLDTGWKKATGMSRQNQLKSEGGPWAFFWGGGVGVDDLVALLAFLGGGVTALQVETEVELLKCSTHTRTQAHTHEHTHAHIHTRTHTYA